MSNLIFIHYVTNTDILIEFPFDGQDMIFEQELHYHWFGCDCEISPVLPTAGLFVVTKYDKLLFSQSYKFPILYVVDFLNQDGVAIANIKTFDIEDIFKYILDGLSLEVFSLFVNGRHYSFDDFFQYQSIVTGTVPYSY